MLASYLQVLAVDAHPVTHGEEAAEVGVVQQDVDRHAPQRGADDLPENVEVSEDVHRYGDNLQTYEGR